MTKQSRNIRICLTLIYAVALGIAVSVTMTLSYQGIRGGADMNHLRLGASVILRGLGFAVPAFGIVWLLQMWVNRCGVCAETEPGGRKLSDRRFFMLIWALLCLSWMPYLMTFYPGGVVGDGAETLEYAINTSVLDNRWVVAQILALRLFAAIGRIFTPDINVGIFLYAMCSGAVYALACAAAVTELRRRGLPRMLVVLCTALYAFAGHYASYGMGLWKDGLFGAGILTLSLLFWKEPEEKVERKGWAVKTGLVFLFLCFWRNFVAWAMLPVGIIMIIVRKQGRRLLAILLIVIAVFSILVQGPVFGALGITETRVSEAFAIPLQQVAAVIQQGTELTENQAETLYHLLPAEAWKEQYTPTLADGIKFSLDDEYLRAHLWDFIRVWFQLGIRHPEVYLKAHLMETLGFWQPYGSNQGFYHDWFVGVQDVYNRGYVQKDLILEGTGTTLSPGLMDRLAYVPSGTVVWIMLLSLVLVLCGPGGKKRRIAVLLPYLLCWFAVTATAPIAYSYRYVEMLAMGLPVFVALPFLREEQEKTKEPGKIRQALASKKVAWGVTLAAAVVMVVVLLCGSFSPYAIKDGKLEIYACGVEDNRDYYIREGLSVNEGSYSWTLGDELKVDFPYYGESEDLEVEIRTAGNVSGAQRYRIRNGTGEQTDAGELFGAGEICFDLQPVDGRIIFTIELPDAVTLPGESRKLAFAVTGIEIREKEEPAKGMPLAGLRVLLAGDSRSSTDYTFYKNVLEAKSGCTALVKGASGKDAAYNASDRYMDLVTGTKHDVSIWLVGGNDDGSEETIDGFRNAIREIMEKYQASYPKGQAPVMIFCTDLPQQRDNAESPWSRVENWERKKDVIRECCEEYGVVCLDLYGLCDFDMSREPYYMEPTDTENDRGVYYMDGLHPNRDGVEVIVEFEVEKIKEVLGK